MYWLHGTTTDKNIVREGVDNMGNENREGKRCFVKNWQLSVGLLIMSITIIMKQTVGLHDFFLGFGEGLGIVLIFFGLLVSSGKSVCGLIKGRKKLTAGDMQ